MISIEGIDVSKYELNVEDFDVEEITKNHLLCLGTEECDEELVIELLEKGADVNFKCEEVDDVITNLAFCKENGVKLTELLIEKGADRMQRDTNRNMGCLPIHGVKSVDMLKLLISKGFEINLLCDNGRNLLHFAAKEGLKESFSIFS